MQENRHHLEKKCTEDDSILRFLRHRDCGGDGDDDSQKVLLDLDDVDVLIGVD